VINIGKVLAILKEIPLDGYRYRTGKNRNESKRRNIMDQWRRYCMIEFTMLPLVIATDGMGKVEWGSVFGTPLQQ
jgi:hypothetical protein